MSQRLDWSAIERRYGRGAELPAVFGNAKLTITGVGPDEVFFASRLWKDSLRRDHLEEAVRMIESGELDRSPSGFLEGFRLTIEVDRSVAPGCSKIPNLAAVVLADLGYFDDPE